MLDTRLSYAWFKVKHNAESLTEVVCTKSTLLKTNLRVLVMCQGAYIQSTKIKYTL